MLTRLRDRLPIATRPGPAPRPGPAALLPAAALALLLLGAGCSKRSEVTLIQPSAPPAQRVLQLASTWAYTRTLAGQRAMLLQFPLPSVPDGPRDFSILLIGPDEPGRQAVGPVAAGGEPAAGDAEAAPLPTAAVRGFLIQAVGQRAGKTFFEGGSIELKREFSDAGAESLHLDLRCDDGSRVVGKAYPVAAGHEFTAFERRYAADVVQLLPVKAREAEPPAGAAAARTAAADDEPAGDQPAEDSAGNGQAEPTGHPGAVDQDGEPAPESR